NEGERARCHVQRGLAPSRVNVEVMAQQTGPAHRGVAGPESGSSSEETSGSSQLQEARCRVRPTLQLVVATTDRATQRRRVHVIGQARPGVATCQPGGLTAERSVRK